MFTKLKWALKQKTPKLFSFLRDLKNLSLPRGYCPFCAKEVPLQTGGRPYPRKGEVCVHCKSMARHRFLFYVYKTVFLSRKSKMRLLHLAPEESFYRMFSKVPEIEYVSGDINPDRYSYVKNCQQIDALAIPFPDHSFDVLIANHLIEHVDEKRFLSEIHRVLKQDGVALLSTPVYPELEQTLEDSSLITPEQRKLQYGHPEHLRKYGRDAASRFVELFNVNYIAQDDLPPFGDKYNSNCFVLFPRKVESV